MVCASDLAQFRIRWPQAGRQGPLKPHPTKVNIQVKPFESLTVGDVGAPKHDRSLPWCEYDASGNRIIVIRDTPSPLPSVVSTTEYSESDHSQSPTPPTPVWKAFARVRAHRLSQTIPLGDISVIGNASQTNQRTPLVPLGDIGNTGQSSVNRNRDNADLSHEIRFDLVLLIPFLPL
jgi:hypothetical protein